MARPRRSFTPEFKARLVLETLTGSASLAELARKNNIKADLIGQWKAAAVERLAELFGGDEQASQDQLRVADLEQLVGRQTLELEILKKASRLLTGRPTPGGRLS